MNWDVNLIKTLKKVLCWVRGWMDGWMDGLVGVKAVLRIAYRNQKEFICSMMVTGVTFKDRKSSK